MAGQDGAASMAVAGLTATERDLADAGAVIWVYVTASDREEATEIGRALVRERPGRLRQHPARPYRHLPRRRRAARSGGSGLRRQDHRGAVEALRTRIRALHSYDLPAILALPVSDGDADFLDWVRAQVAPT